MGEISLKWQTLEFFGDLLPTVWHPSVLVKLVDWLLSPAYRIQSVKFH